MSMFEKGGYCWRETYFVLFESSKRPSLKAVKKALSHVNDRFMLTNLDSDEAGQAESLTVLAPDDYAAVDICYLDGEEVREQAAQLVEDIQAFGCDEGGREKIAQIRRCDARFDVLHFEQVVDDADEEADENLDPTALLVVLDALAKLTGGVAVDPQAGTTM